MSGIHDFELELDSGADNPEQKKRFTSAPVYGNEGVDC